MISGTNSNIKNNSYDSKLFNFINNYDIDNVINYEISNNDTIGEYRDMDTYEGINTSIVDNDMTLSNIEIYKISDPIDDNIYSVGVVETWVSENNMIGMELRYILSREIFSAKFDYVQDEIINKIIEGGNIEMIRIFKYIDMMDEHKSTKIYNKLKTHAVDDENFIDAARYRDKENEMKMKNPDK